MKLIPKQENAVYYLKDEATREVLYGGAAGGGKSALGCLWLMEMCQTYEGSRWLMGRAKLKTLKETTLATFFELASKLGISGQFTYNGQANTLTWYNGSVILLKDLFAYPSDPEFDALGSLEICGAFIDEVSQISFKAWQIVRSRCRYKLKEFGLVPKILGSCNPTKRWPYKQFYKPYKDRELKPGRAFVQSLPTDNPHLPESYLEALLSLDETSCQRLYFGKWEYDNDPAKLVDYEAIMDLWRNDHVPGGTKYITADIARYGSDKGVIVVWEGLSAIEMHTLSLSSIPDTASKIKALMNRYGVLARKVICDEDGVGGGVVDILGCRGFVNGSVALPEEHKKVEYANLKTQCYYHLAEAINRGDMFLAEALAEYAEKITEELEQVKRDKVDKDGKLYMQSKEVTKQILGRSPDYSDALMMRMWYEIKPVSNNKAKTHGNKTKGNPRRDHYKDIL